MTYIEFHRSHGGTAMYKTILVPIDLAHPEHGKEMIALAQAVATDEARIVLLNVMEAVPSYVVAQLPAGLHAEQAKKAKAALADLARESGAEVDVQSGHAPSAILEGAQRIGADLIVIASHRPGLQDYFLGSTASRVVRHAPCAVLVHR
jgi:nucleotide-binding universal stress UspA family protein